MRLWRSTSCLLEYGLNFQGSKICWIDCWGPLPGLRYPHQRKTSELYVAFDSAPLGRPFSGTPRWFQSLVVVRSHVVLWICTCHVWTVGGGTSVKGSNIWQTCYESHESWWVMTLFSLFSSCNLCALGMICETNAPQQKLSRPLIGGPNCSVRRPSQRQLGGCQNRRSK